VLALIMGISGCAAFLLILTSRRDELATLRADLASRLARGKQERFAAKLTWEAIQRIELCETAARIWDIMEAATARMGCDHLRVSCLRDGDTVFDREVEGGSGEVLSGSMATFRLTSGRDLLLIVSVRQAPDSTLEADIAFRFVQRLSLASAERLERLFSKGPAAEAEPPVGPTKSPEGLIPSPMMARRIAATRPGASGESALDYVSSPSARPPMGWLRGTLGWSSARVTPARSLGEE
jgi:UDP-GlcNAc:undecaprenyl-phosphate GlcNAc-1-phosphate transferase